MRQNKGTALDKYVKARVILENRFLRVFSINLNSSFSDGQFLLRNDSFAFVDLDLMRLLISITFKLPSCVNDFSQPSTGHLNGFIPK